MNSMRKYDRCEMWWIWVDCGIEGGYGMWHIGMYHVGDGWYCEIVLKLGGVIVTDWDIMGIFAICLDYCGVFCL